MHKVQNGVVGQCIGCVWRIWEYMEEHTLLCWATWTVCVAGREYGQQICICMQRFQTSKSKKDQIKTLPQL